MGTPPFGPQISLTGACDATDKGASNVFVGAPEGPALIPTRGAPKLIVDPHSENRTGKVAFIVFTFVDVLIQRLNTHFYALTGVQDQV